MRGRALLALALSGWAATVAAEPRVAIVPLPFAATEFRGPDTRVAALVATTDALRGERGLAGQPVVVTWGRNGAAVLVVDGDAIRAVPLGGSSADLVALESGRDAIPDSRVQVAGPFTVALTGPTRDYPHDALGSFVHARAVTIRERRPVSPGGDPKPVPTVEERVEAGPGAVFEDRAPRLADLDGDGVPEIVTVKSYADRGAALAVIGRRDGHWRIVAETPPVGAATLWLDPAAIADFDGGGRPEIALVRTPHRDGTLQLWAFAGDALALRAALPGYANHGAGHAAQDLASPVRLDAGAPPLLAIPTLDRRSLALVSFRGGVAERLRIALPAAVTTGVATLGTGAGLHILVGLEDGRIADVRP